MFKFIIIIFVCVINVQLYAYNSYKCNRATPPTPLVGPFLLSTSTSQFVSSTGPCAMIGQLEHDKKVFIAQNYDELKLEIAQGHGETLNAFASLSKCSGDSVHVFPKLMQNNYELIYSSESSSVDGIYNAIEGVIKSNELLSGNCGIRS